ncbi:RNA polymerase sigma factor [Carboxylicivirga marina]|uniref:RNA polymerase sigma factor n=1 Tax=Carboxylicivirga marina TaxID=2800988 RepID=UPI002594469E|nr:RNA polymerase sigma-70 factor [uncultured Carboxylicivirga sp.]
MGGRLSTIYKFNNIQRIKSGNSQAFKEMFEEFYTPLCSFAYKYLKDSVSSADVVQDVFLTIWNSHTDFSNVGALRSYLFTSVRNSCLNAIRNAKVNEHTKDVFPDVQCHDTADEYEIETMVYAEVHKAIKHLSPQAREVVIHSMNGLTNIEIAEELKVSVNTIKTMKKRAYKSLREKLGGMRWVLVILFG